MNVIWGAQGSNPAWGVLSLSRTVSNATLASSRDLGPLVTCQRGIFRKNNQIDIVAL